MKRSYLLFIMLALAVPLTLSSCAKDDAVEGQKNIVELAQGNSDLSSLVAAVKRAGLVDALSDATKQFTVFAPTNAAFTTFLNANGFANLEAVPVSVLQNLLLNHVLGAEVKAAAVTTGYVNTLATYGTSTSHVDMFINTTGGVQINGLSKVVAADVDASNGVVHVVDAVIPVPSVPTFAVANPDFSILVQALTRSDLAANYASVLSGPGPFTVFAPTNAAFAALLSELGVAALKDIPAATLEAVLTYHVASGNVLAGSLTEGQQVTTLQKGNFTIRLAGGAKITDANNRVINIIATDIQGGNGVVHAIDKVLLP
ncbi:MAG: fasciclin domain-containing protein [Saprospiraceae bacterium]|nr:fasciclin domain-containing protein [Saprospiraceae bacterium]